MSAPIDRNTSNASRPGSSLAERRRALRLGQLSIPAQEALRNIDGNRTPRPDITPQQDRISFQEQPTPTQLTYQDAQRSSHSRNLSNISNSSDMQRPSTAESSDSNSTISTDGPSTPRSHENLEIPESPVARNNIQAPNTRGLRFDGMYQRLLRSGINDRRAFTAVTRHTEGQTRQQIASDLHIDPTLLSGREWDPIAQNQRLHAQRDWREYAENNHPFALDNLYPV